MHHPPHIYLDDAWYIITAATLGHALFLASDQAKALVRDRLKELFQEFSITLRAWVILNNHYHLLLKTHTGHDLARHRIPVRLRLRRLNFWVAVIWFSGKDRLC